MMPIEAAISDTLRRRGPCSLDDVVKTLSNFMWAEIFLAVDRMSRDGRLSLRQLGGSTYQLELRSEFAYSRSGPSQTMQKGGEAVPA